MEYILIWGLHAKRPAVLDINTVNISAFPYNTNGHYVNVSGYDDRGGTNKVRITDPYWTGFGNKWYNETDVYNANNQHWRQSMIY